MLFIKFLTALLVPLAASAVPTSSGSHNDQNGLTPKEITAPSDLSTRSVTTRQGCGGGSCGSCSCDVNSQCNILCSNTCANGGSFTCFGTCFNQCVISFGGCPSPSCGT
ncbi:hypothetical protein BGW80DRAFT_1343667 [Lactifluus volemus]|nr:hypothetical protein BGW80DRAFT_1343667 [Lactifluus volemus]